MKPRDNAIDAVKGFAIMLVMIGHCIRLNELQEAYVYDMIAAIQMPLFMTVSGYLAGLGRRPDSFKGTAAVIGKRAVAYLLPFFSWMLLTHLTHPLAELKLTLHQIDRGLWFLITLFILTIVAVIANVLADKLINVKGGFSHLLVFLCLCGTAYCVFFLQERSGNRFLGPDFTVKYMPFYLMGYVVSGYFMKWREKTAWLKKCTSQLVLWTFWTCSLVVFLSFVIAYDMVYADSRTVLLVQMIASVLGTYVTFFAVYQIASRVPLRILSFVGLYTLEIYVLHFRFARLLGISDRNLNLYSLQGILWVAAAFALMSLLTALCIIVIKLIPPLNLVLFGKLETKYGVHRLIKARFGNKQ